MADSSEYQNKSLRYFPKRKKVFLINISSVIQEMESQYLRICFTNIFFQSLINNKIVSVERYVIVPKFYQIPKQMEKIDVTNKEKGIIRNSQK
jgi:hypothetical protein